MLHKNIYNNNNAIRIENCNVIIKFIQWVNV